jgi:hypothetical protein
MTSVVPQLPVTHVTAKPNPRPRIIWSRRDYHERLNLHRIVSRRQVNLPVLQTACERKEMTCDQN